MGAVSDQPEAPGGQPISPYEAGDAARRIVFAVGAGLLRPVWTADACGIHSGPKVGGLRVAWNASDHDGPRCQYLAGRSLEELITAVVLEAMAPATLEPSLAAVDDLQAERRRLDELWRQRLEQARYEARHAERQHAGVDPEIVWSPASWSGDGSRPCWSSTNSKISMIIFAKSNP